MRNGQEFCSQCYTSIVDFTEMTDEEIRAYVSAQAGTFCVKIHSDQLQRVKGRKSTLRQNLAVAATAAFLAIANESGGQATDSVRTEQVENSPVTNMADPEIVGTDSSSGTACEQGMALDGATFKKVPLKKKVFLRLRYREFYVMNKAPFFGSRRRGGFRGKF